ncbi:SUMF1/EgtB/PvdO family nonheme iron enzyme [Haliscomenobacter hydrossis]|uniref:Sulphatase-modifying factor protein n=1 Tax=Haliscomenobacter hydrossis (strain ATCC 27775 / DSM 1100 / LMG 10767 / O) TaxID=760192 RepID=F4KVP9_HALH1|nr:SUMF1/EgtB/PvdO family nonheme iron enzyme [Haliscomenobacter hydrossis]AEE52506.1 Sulphatase-modifying factor protein [Haliscomenobacter hydrossis DSM 1100]
MKKRPFSLVIALFICTLSNAQRSGKDYAIFFYVTDFKPGWAKLPETQVEATAIKNELSTNFDFTCEMVPNPSKQLIRDKIQQYNQRLTSNDQVFFFFSMHGYYAELADRGYLVASDGLANDPYGYSYLSYDDLRADLGLCRAKHVMLALDACHSGSFGIRSKGDPDAPIYELNEDCNTRINKTMQYKGRQYCTSGNKNAKTPAKSLFAARLLEALRKGGEGGIIHFDDLEYWLGKVANPQPEGGTFGSHDPGGDFVFVKKYACGSLPSPPPGNIDLEKDFAAWQQAKQSDNIEGYLTYLRIFPNGEFRELANLALQKKETDAAQRRDDLGWNVAEEFKTIAAYQKYQRDFPNGLHYNEATEKIKKLQVPDDGLVLVKGGSFTMGCTSEQQNCGEDEKPTHQVNLGDFYLSKNELTIGEYLKFADETRSHYPEWLEQGSKYNLETGSDDHYKNKGLSRNATDLPVVGVSWEDAKAYCEWLSRKTGLKYRLPTEAEWEYAARGGGLGITQTNFQVTQYAGSNSIDEVAWHSSNSGSKPHPVGQKKPNRLGLYDMSGNVWEWCADWYDSSYYKNSPSTNPPGAITGSDRVCRGGSWNYVPRDARMAGRGRYTPVNRIYDIGFRVARTL